MDSCSDFGKRHVRGGRASPPHEVIPQGAAMRRPGLASPPDQQEKRDALAARIGRQGQGNGEIESDPYLTPCENGRVLLYLTPKRESSNHKAETKR